MQAVCELDQNDAHVARHRQQHFAKILRLCRLVAFKFDLVEFGQTVNQLTYRRAKSGRNIGNRDAGVFNHIVQQGRDQRLGIKLPGGTNAGNRERVGDVLLTAGAHLPLMCVVAVSVSSGDALNIGGLEVTRKS